MLLAATIIIGATAIFSIPAAAIVYVPFYLVLCWIRPYAALALMMGEVAFPFDVNNSGLAHTAPAEISLCLAFPVFWLRALADGRRGVPSPMTPAITAYFFICVISTFMYFTGRDAIVSILQMALYLILAVKFFSSLVPNRGQVFTALHGLIAATTFMSIAILYYRKESIFGIHKNATGTFLSYTVLILAEMWLLAATGRRKKLWLNILLLINVGGLIMSSSRGAWMGCTAGMAVLLISRRQFGLFFRAMLLMIPAIVACAFLMPQEQLEYAMGGGDSSHGSLESRIANNEFFADKFMQSPVIGMGVGLRKERDSTNIIMSTLAETGVLGLLAFLAIQISFFWVIFRAIRHVPRDDPDFTILVLGAALVLCLFIHGQVDHYWSRTQLPVYGMAGAAIGVAYARRNLARRI
jgi:O-antigen ligase